MKDAEFRRYFERTNARFDQVFVELRQLKADVFQLTADMNRQFGELRETIDNLRDKTAAHFESVLTPILDRLDRLEEH